MHDLERAGVEIVNLIEDAKTTDNIVEFRQAVEETPVKNRARKS
jgi:biopolymer transport protein ExbB